MAEYIERDALLSDIEAAEKHKGMGMVVAQTLKRYVKRAPAADVAPVVHGLPVRKNRPKKYEWYEEIKTENGEILYRKHVYVDETNWAEYCSACGKRLCSRFKSYCPNCGAKMDLEESK